MTTLDSVVVDHAIYWRLCAVLPRVPAKLTHPDWETSVAGLLPIFAAKVVQREKGRSGLEAAQPTVM